MLLSLIRMIQAYRDYQRNVSELSQLSDSELADIGLDRQREQRPPEHVPLHLVLPASSFALVIGERGEPGLGRCRNDFTEI